MIECPAAAGKHQKRLYFVADVAILVTGATGFLGRRIAQELAHHGETIRLLVRPHSDLRGLAGEPFETRIGDLTQEPSLRAALQGCRIVVHSAAMVKAYSRDREAFDRVNVTGTRSLMQAALEAGVERFLYTSSFFALGPTGPDPVDESWRHREGIYFTDYERTKHLAHKVALDFIARGLPLIVLLPGFVYGPGNLTEGNLVVRLIRDLARGRLPGIPGRGDKLWGFTYVDSVARGHLLALQKGVPGEHYLLVDENATLNQMVALLREVTGARLPQRHLPLGILRALAAGEELRARWFGATPQLVRGGVDSFTVHWAYRSDKARAELGFVPLPLRVGLEQTYLWLQEQGLI
jgi:nucleoside-diphosphate-sugar epimerase